MADDKPITKKDLETVIQTVKIQNESQRVEIDDPAAITKPLIEQQKKNDLKELEKQLEERSIFQSIADGLTDMRISFTEGLAGLGDKLKEKGKGTLAGLIALISAPFIIFAGFFQQLGVEFKFLDKLTKGKLSNKFKPVKDFFRRMLPFFDDIAKFASKSKIGKFFLGIGKGLGKLFLPITILLGIIDFVKGFMKGFEEEGLVGGIREGLTSLLAGLTTWIFSLVGFITGGLFDLLGMSDLGDKVREFFETFKNGFVKFIRSAWNFTLGLFTFDKERMIEAVGDLFQIFKNGFNYVTEFMMEQFKKIAKVPFIMKLGIMIKSFFAKIQGYIVGLAKKIPILGSQQWVKDMEAGVDRTLEAIEKERQELADLQAAKTAPVVVVPPSGSGGTTNNSSSSVTYNVSPNVDISIDALNAAMG